MNIREGMGIKTIEGALGIITKAEMKSHNGEVWYDLCIKPVNNNGYVSEYHGLEKICINTLCLLAVRICKQLV